MKDDEIRKAYMLSPFYGAVNKFKRYEGFRSGYKYRDKEISELKEKLNFTENALDAEIINRDNANRLVCDLEEKLKIAIETLEFIHEECNWEEVFFGGDKRIGPAITKALKKIKDKS